MIEGCFRDLVQEADGTPRREGSWQPNQIVATVWPLVVGLLRQDPVVRGITHCAVGSGDPAWDTAPVRPDPGVTHLHNEVARVSLGQDDFAYLDATTQRVRWPTMRLEVRVTLAITQPLTLREFGLVGVEAGGAPGGGTLIDYVVHPRLELRPGQTLTRRVQLHFGTAAGAASLGSSMLSGHPLGRRPVTDIDGVGPAAAALLKRAGVKTLQDLAQQSLSGAVLKIAPAKLLALQAKARLALLTAAQLPLVPALAERSVAELSLTPVKELAAATGITLEMSQRLHEQLALLHLALDSRALRRMALGELLART
jgi:hypothetical protein